METALRSVKTGIFQIRSDILLGIDSTIYKIYKLLHNARDTGEITETRDTGVAERQSDRTE